MNTKMAHLKSKSLAAVAFVAVVSIQVNPSAFADETDTPSNIDWSVNESPTETNSMELSVDEGHSFSIDDGIAKILGNSGEEIETLPSALTNELGSTTPVSYDPVEDNKVLVHYKDSWWQNWGKCVAGTAGGAITAGGTGAGTGAGVGVAGGPWGAGAGAIGGAAIGGVGGGLTGAAAAC